MVLTTFSFKSCMISNPWHKLQGEHLKSDFSDCTFMYNAPGFLSNALLSFYLSLVIFLFLSIHETPVIFHDHSDIKSRAAPHHLFLLFSGGNYLPSLRLTLLVCAHFRSIIPIKFRSFSVPLSGKSTKRPPSNTYEWIRPWAFSGCLPKRIGCHCEGMREEKHKRSRDENPPLRTLLTISWFLSVCSFEPSIRSRCEIAHAYHLW